MVNQDYYELLNKALYALEYSTDRMLLVYITNDVKNECTPDEIWETDNKIKQNLTHAVSMPLDQLPINMLKLNLSYYCQALWQKIQKEQPNIKFPTYRAINYLTLNNLHFTTDVIYQKNGDDLSVEKILDLVGYGLKFINIAFNADTEKLENYNTALKCLNRILHNDKPQNPIKDLSYILEVLFAIQNHFEQNEQEKKNNKIISLSVSIFIEFLTKTSE